MLLTAKKIALSGLLLAVDAILLILSGVFEASTLFFLAAASFCVGIVQREQGTAAGWAFFTASVLLGLILAPNKIYVGTYALMALYILISEMAFRRLFRLGWERKKQTAVFWVIRFALFNVMYLPCLFLVPRMFYSGRISGWIWAAFILGGQLALLVYDRAYCYFQGRIWEKVRRKFWK